MGDLGTVDATTPTTRKAPPKTLAKRPLSTGRRIRMTWEEGGCSTGRTKLCQYAPALSSTDKLRGATHTSLHDVHSMVLTWVARSNHTQQRRRCPAFWDRGGRPATSGSHLARAPPPLPSPDSRFLPSCASEINYSTTSATRL